MLQRIDFPSPPKNVLDENDPETKAWYQKCADIVNEVRGKPDSTEPPPCPECESNAETP